MYYNQLYICKQTTSKANSCLRRLYTYLLHEHVQCSKAIKNIFILHLFDTFIIRDAPCRKLMESMKKLM